MRRLAKLCAALFFMAGLHLAAQTGAISSQAIDQFGQPLPHAQIRVCSATSTGVPCNPTVPIFLDYNLTTQVSNPYSTDQYGNYGFYVPTLPFPNVYVVQVSPANGITWSYLFDGPGGTGAAGCIPGGANGTLLASNGSGGCISAFVQVNNANLTSPISPNFIDSPTVTVSNPGTNQVSFAVVAGTALAISTNSTPNTTQSLLNFTDTATIHFTNPSGGVESATCVTATNSQIGCARPDNTSVTISGGVLSSITTPVSFKHDGTLLTGPFAANPQIYDYDESTPAANGGFLTATGNFDTATGKWNVQIPSTLPPAIQMGPVAPVPGQYVVLYPQTRSGVSGSGGFCQDLGNWGMQLNGASGLIVGATCAQTMSGPWETATGKTLADLGISTGSVTTVYTFAFASYYPGYFDDGSGPVASSRGLTCDGISVLAATLEFSAQQTTGLTGLSGAGIAGATCAQSMARNSSIQTTSSTAAMSVPSMGLIVYYSGSPASDGSTINVAPPLVYDSITKTLGLSPLFPNILYPSVVSLLPSALANVGAEVNVTDSNSPFSCSTGGGLFVVGCIATIAGWVPKSSITPSLYAQNLEGGFLGSIPYQTAPNITAFVASPTTVGHTYAMGWVPVAQPQVVQANSCNNTSCTFLSPVTSGDLVFVATVDRFGPPFGCTISDTFGTTYTNVQTALGATGFTGVLASSGTDVISAGGPDATRCGLLIVEISGANATPVDVAGSVVGTTGASFTPSVTTTGTNDLILLWQGTTGNSATTITQSLSATFLAGTGLSGGALQNVWSLPAPTATAYTSTITQSPTGNVNLGSMIAFKSGSGGAIAPQAIDLTATIAGVSSITPGTNVTCTPLSAGTCIGAVTINAAGGGGTVTTTGSPASGDIAAFSSSSAITTATATQVNTLIKTLTGCNTATFVYTPQAADCVAPSSGTLTGSGTTGFLLKWTGSTAAGNSALDDGITTVGHVTSSEPMRHQRFGCKSISIHLQLDSSCSR